MKVQIKQATPATDAFMDEFKENTQPHPFDRHQRIWKDDVGLNVSPFGNYIYFGSVMTFGDKGTGLASKALKWVTDLADKYKVELHLEVVPLKNAGSRGGAKSLNKAQLKDWYKRNGFTGSGENMVRKPKND